MKFTPDEYNYYVNWALYAVLGRLQEADALMQRFGKPIRSMAKKLAKSLGVPKRAVYRGMVLDPGEIGGDLMLQADPNYTFVSWSEDKSVACWFADRDSVISGFVRMLRPQISGWIAEAWPDKKRVLFHWSWAERFPTPHGVGTVPLWKLSQLHRDMIPAQVEWAMKTQKEVILRQDDKPVKVIPHAQAGCPPTADLDARLTFRGNPGKARRALGRVKKAVGRSRSCYPAAEVVYHAGGGKRAGLTPVQQRHEGESHWWVRGPGGEVLDPAAAQFRRPVPYERGKGKGFLTKRPSKRARALARRSGVKLNPSAPNPNPVTRILLAEPELLNCTPYEINNGLCIDVAEKIETLVPGAEELTMPTASILPGHAWIYYQGKHYDAEAPHGVDHYLDLPIYRRWIARHPGTSLGPWTGFFGPRSNPDADLRALERRAAAGDYHAAAALERAVQRTLPLPPNRLERYYESRLSWERPDSRSYLSPYGDYGVVPHSELAMHSRAAGRPVVQYALWGTGDGYIYSASVLYIDQDGDESMVGGGRGEVLPDEVRRELGGFGAEKFPKASL